MSKECYERTLKAVELLLANSEQMQKMYKDLWRTNVISYAKEICTIKVCGPRRSGHTTVVNELVKRFNDQVIVIAPTRETCQYITATHKYGIKSMDRLRGLSNIKAVIVDISSVMSRSDLDKMYKDLSIHISLTDEDEQFFFILME